MSEAKNHRLCAVLTLALAGCTADSPDTEASSDKTQPEKIEQHIDNYEEAQAAIEAKYAELGSEDSPLGAPLRGIQDCDYLYQWETWCAYQQFEDGRIYYLPDYYSKDAYAMYGAIYAYWNDQPRYVSGEYKYGIPSDDETGTPDGVGRYNYFRYGNGSAAIYWTPDLGAVPVINWALRGWSKNGWEQGPWGYPVAPGRSNDDQRCGPNYDYYLLWTQDFQNGYSCSDEDSNDWFIPYH